MGDPSWSGPFGFLLSLLCLCPSISCEECGNKLRPIRENKQKLFTQIALTRRSATIVCTLQRPEGREKRGRALEWAGMKGHACALMEAAGLQELEAG